MDMDTEEEMQVIANEPQVILLGMRSVEIYKCKVRQLTKITAFLKTVVGALGLTDVNTQELKIDLNDPITYTVLFDTCYDDTVELISSLCGLTRDELEDLELDEMFLLVSSVFEVNKSFFLNRVLPLVKGLYQTNQQVA